MKRIARTCLPLAVTAVLAVAAIWVALAVPTLSNAATNAVGIAESPTVPELYARSPMRSAGDLFPGHR